jgi:hypothetical protein
MKFHKCKSILLFPQKRFHICETSFIKSQINDIQVSYRMIPFYFYFIYLQDNILFIALSIPPYTDIRPITLITIQR